VKGLWYSVYSRGGDWGALYLLIEIEIIVVVPQHSRERVLPTALPALPDREPALVQRFRAGIHRPGGPANPSL
jgi:hypothetical protein